MSFRKYNKTTPVFITVYADFEAFTTPTQSLSPDPGKSYTEVLQLHYPSSYGLKLVCNYDDRFSLPVEIYRGKDDVIPYLYRFVEINYECNIVAEENFNKPLNDRDGNDWLLCNNTLCSGMIQISSVINVVLLPFVTIVILVVNILVRHIMSVT